MTLNHDGTTARFSTVPLVLAGFLVVLLLAAARPLGVAAQEMEEEHYSAFGHAHRYGSDRRDQRAD